MPDSLLQIRPYHPDDKERVLALFRSNTPTYFSLEEEADLSDYLDNEIEVYSVLLLSNKIVGAGGINTK